MKRKFSISDILSKISRENLKKRFKEAAQMINLIYRNYSDGETQMLSTSLTYFSMLAIFPIVALILGITKGFGLDRLFIRKIFEIVPQNEGMVRTVLDVANKLLVSTEGSILTGVGVVILINSAIKVLMVLEDSFNKIWHVNKNRSFTRRIIDYIAIIFIGPIFFIVIIATNSYVIEKAGELLLGKTLVIGLFIKLIGPSFYILLFTLLFYLIPNTNVKLKPAFISGVVTALLCFILKAAFVFLQSFITKYNAIYGSLAFIPIFLVWVQYIWVTILLGAQIAFSIQTSDEFLYSEKIEMPIKIKREAGILILSLIIKNFVEKKESFTYQKLTDRLGMEVFFVKEVLSDLEKMGFINEVFYDKNSDSQYQVAYSPESITIREFMRKFDTKNIEYYENIFDNLNGEDQKLLEKIREKLAMKKIESPEPEPESDNTPEKEEATYSESGQPEHFQNPIKSRKSEELTIDFQISKQKNENSQVKDSPKIIRKEKINREPEAQTSKTEDKNSENTQKKVRYEDGTWKFF